MTKSSDSPEPGVGGTGQEQLAASDDRSHADPAAAPGRPVEPDDSAHQRSRADAFVLDEIPDSRERSGGMPIAVLGLALVVGLVFVAAFWYATREVPRTPEQILARAEMSQRAGLLEAAVLDYKTVLAANPELIEARWALAQLYQQIGDYRGAREQADGLAARGMQSEDFWLFRAELLLALGDPTAAMGVLASSPFSPTLAQPHVLRGEANLGLGRAHVAEMDFNRALQLDRTSARARNGKAHVALQRQETTRALRLLSEVLKTHPDNAQSHHLRAAAYLLQDRPQLATRSVQAALDAEPLNPFIRLTAARVALANQELDAANEQLDWLTAAGYQRADIEHARALVALEREDIDQARRLLGSALASAKNHPASLLTLAALHYTEADFDQSRVLLERYLQDDPSSTHARLMLAEILLRAGQATQAVDLLTGVNLEDPSALRLLGEAYAARGDFNSALREFERARERGASDANLRQRLASAYLWTGASGKAVRELYKAITDRKGDARAQTLLVLAFLRDNKPERAREAAEAFARQDPENALAVNLLGGVLQQLGDAAGARTQFERALALQPELAAAAHNLARLDVRQGDRQGAAVRYEKLLERNPDDVRAMTGLAAIAAQRGQDEFAVTLLERARALDPRAVAARLMLVGRYLGVGQAAEALTIAQEAYRTGAGREAVEIAVGRAQLAMGQTQEARATLEQATRAFPDSAEAQFRLAEVLLRQGNDQHARAALERALELDQRRLDAAGALVTLLLDQGQVSQAAARLSKLQGIAANHPIVRALRGAVLTAQGDPVGAANALLEALTANPSADVLRQTVSALHRAGRSGEVAPLLDTWLRERPQSREGRLLSALEAHRSGQLDKAVAAYELLLERDHRSATVLNNLAWIRFERGDPSALELSREAAELAPRSADFLDTYGWLLVHAGRSEDALAVLKRAAARDEEGAEKAFHLAVAQAVFRGDDEIARALPYLVAKDANAPHFRDVGRLLLQRYDRPRAALYALQLAHALDSADLAVESDIAAARERLANAFTSTTTGQ